MPRPYLHDKRIRRLSLYGDPDDKTIQLLPAEATDQAACLLTYTFAQAPTPTCATLVAAPFLQWLGYHAEHSLRCTLQIALHPLLRRGQEYLTFIATPDQGTPAPQGRPPCD